MLDYVPNADEVAAWMAAQVYEEVQRE